VPEIVSWNILAVVGEFHSGAAARGSTFGTEMSGEDSLGYNAEVFEFLPKLVIK